MPTGDIMEVKYHCYTGNQLGLVVRHYRITGSGIVGQNAEQRFLGDKLSETAAPTFKGAMSEKAKYQGLTIQRVNPAPKTALTLHTVGAGFGAVAGDLLPKQTCGVITLRTDLAGRSRRGRAYIPFPSETSNDADNGRPVPAYLASLDGFQTVFASDLQFTEAGQTVAVEPIIFSKLLSQAEKITSNATRAFWGSQRRRGDFGRANASVF